MPHGAIAALGLTTIAAYGAGFYAFGVLLDPIVADTGWSEALVAASFSGSTLIGALGAGQAGRLTDEYGAGRVMLVGGLLGCVFLLLAATATIQLFFLFAYALGGGRISATGFYHITQAAVARIGAANPARAIMLLTLYGAFAGPIYLPATGFLVETTDWRTTIAILSTLSALGFLVAGIALHGADVPAKESSETPSVRQALSDPIFRHMLFASFVGGVGITTMMVYQVPLMVTAGLSLGTAASISGIRGFAQFAGRAGIIPLMPRFGARRILIGTYIVATAAAVLLAFSGTIQVAIAYVLVAGVAIGIYSPMVAVYVHELAPTQRVATLMGTERMISGLGGAAGPLVAGITAEVSGDRSLAIFIVLAGTILAALILGLSNRPGTSLN